jgi:hypothetical protein
MIMQIATYLNKEYGIAALVTEISRGYAVTLLDTDAEQIVPTVRIFPFDMLAQAIVYAKQIANLKD